MMKDNRLSNNFTYYGCLAILCLVIPLAPFGCKKETEELAFDLDEVSAFEVPEKLHWSFVCGQTAECNELPDPNVREYPSLKSDKPLYGSVKMPYEHHQKPPSPLYHFVIDESAGTGKGYDRLYFDLNLDQDLTNDTLLLIQDDPPQGAILKSSSIKEQVYFQCIDVPFDFGPEGHLSLDILPRLIMREDDSPLLTFVATTARKGKINIARRKYDVWLGQIRRITGSFDHPLISLYLIPKGGLNSDIDWYPMWLRSAQKIGRKHFLLSTTPTGDKLIVRPYKGAYGTFKMGSGNRDIRKAKFSGRLYSAETDFAVGGKPDKRGRYYKPVHNDKVPVGDYSPSLEVYLDRLHVTISDNIHSDGKRMARLEGPHQYPVKIRQDKPFVLDFSNKPEIMFVAPAQNHNLKLGEKLNVEAVLTDPVLDIRFSDIELADLDYEIPNLLIDDDHFPYIITFMAGLVVALLLWLLSLLIRSKRRFFLIAAGLVTILTIGPAVVWYVCSLELDYREISPSVSIKRSDGEIVAGGPMPFG
jgi:hypothetical protein